MGPAGTIEDVRFENVTAQAENGLFISGRVGGVQNVFMKNLHLLIQQLPCNNASFGPCPSHNYWPTSEPGGWSGTSAPVDGVFVEYSKNVTFEDFYVAFAGQPKLGNKYGTCLRRGNKTSLIVTRGHLTCHMPEL